MNFLEILSQMTMLFLVVIVGYIANKTHVMDANFSKKLTNLVLSVANPCMILASVLTSDNEFSLGQLGYIMIVSVVSYAVGLLLALIVPRLMRTPVSSRGVYQFMLVFGNVAFIGFPVMRAVFGSDAVFYAAMFNMPFNILVFTVGVMMMSSQEEEFHFDWKLLVSPSMVASAVALVLALSNIRFPALVCDTVDFIGQITTPTALLIIGSTIADIPLRGIAGGPRVWITAVVRLLISPVLLWLILRGWVSDPLILGVAVVMQGMPVAANCTMLALQYDGDTTTASQGVFLTTLCSVVTIPLVTLLL